MLRGEASSNTFIPLSPRVMTTALQPKCASRARPASSTDFFVCKRAGDEKSCFLCVANDGAGATIRVEARSFWLHENGNFQLMRGAEDAVGEVVGDETFVVVGENERVEMFERGKKQAQKFFLSFVAERFAALVIHANNLLVAGNNARFYGGDALRIGDNSFVHDVCGAQTFLQSAPGFIISNNAEHFHFGAERGNVCADVAGAAEAFALLDEINDGNRRFRRKARGRAPEVAIEHQVSRTPMRLPRRRWIHRFKRGTESEMLLDMRALSFFPFLPELFWSDGRFFGQHYGNAVAHRIDAAARSAFQA